MFGTRKVNRSQKTNETRYGDSIRLSLEYGISIFEKLDTEWFMSTSLHIKQNKALSENFVRKTISKAIWCSMPTSNKLKCTFENPEACVIRSFLG